MVAILHVAPQHGDIKGIYGTGASLSGDFERADGFHGIAKELDSHRLVPIRAKTSRMPPRRRTRPEGQLHPCRKAARRTSGGALHIDFGIDFDVSRLISQDVGGGNGLQQALNAGHDDNWGLVGRPFVRFAPPPAASEHAAGPFDVVGQVAAILGSFVVSRKSLGDDR